MKKWQIHTPKKMLNIKPSTKLRLHRRSLFSKALALWSAHSLSVFNSTAFSSSKTKSWDQEKITPDKHRLKFIEKEYEAIVIGSGFGGAVTGLRLSKKYGNKVLIVERGRRYPKGSFSRDLDDLVNSFWRHEGDRIPRPVPFPGSSHGVFDLRSYHGIDTLVASGFGGGSLIYAAAIAEPMDPNFDKHWPQSIKKENLTYYFDVFRKVMGARTVPQEEPQRKLIRHDLFSQASLETGGVFKKADVAINFGNDHSNPDPMGTISLNPYGAKQASCKYCAECILGCNDQAKNSLDLNYLYVAEQKYQAEVKTEHQVEKIIPLDQLGQEDENFDGTYGFHVYMKPLDSSDSQIDYIVAKTQRVVVAAGVLGSNELLLRNKLIHKSLPRISSQLGRNFSGNGDFLNLVYGAKQDDGSHFGPTVTLESSHNREKDYKPGEAFIMEDLSYPSHTKLLSWVVRIFEPRTFLGRRIMLPLYKKILNALESNDPQSGFMTILLGVGLDKSDGVMSLEKSGKLKLKWKGHNSKKLYDHMINISINFKKVWEAKAVTPFPTYLLGRNFTVHPLGGCALAETDEHGVVDAKPENFGVVFNYHNLYVADGSILPSAVGANPALTIGALAEMIAEGITGERSTGEL